MKKTIIFLLLLSIASQLSAQGKLKKIYYLRPSYKKVSAFDKSSGLLIFKETWDTLTGLTALRKSYYRGESFTYDFGDKKINTVSKNFYYSPNGQLFYFENCKKETQKDGNGNIIFESVENFNTDDFKLNGLKNNYAYYNKANLGEVKKLKFDKSLNDYNLVFFQNYNYQNDCITGSNVFIDKGSFQPYLSENYTYLDDQCHLLEYKKTQKQTTIIEKVNFSYKNNFKDVFTRNIYPTIDCRYGLLDSMHTTANDLNQIILSEKWAGQTYQKQEFFYTPTGKLEKTNNQYKEDSTFANSTIFYYYDKNDSLVLQKRYGLNNGKIDSTRTYIFQENTFQYDNQNRLTLKKYTSEQKIDSIVTFRYNCKGFLEKKTIAYDAQKVFSVEKYEYFDDPCNTATLSANEVLLYPNPSNSLLNIRTNENEKPFQIKLFNSLGKEILMQKIENYDIDIQLNINELMRGMYFLEVYFTQNDKIVKPFIKN
jgi:Secretion system C-terminal sorting domain